jgi:hypothetical protein
MADPLVDPRTLKVAAIVGDCHLLPRRLKGVPRKTVRLDRSFDNLVGSACDSCLYAFKDCMVGETLSGKFSFAGGSKVQGELDVRNGRWRVKVKSRASQMQRALEKAFGWKPGQPNVVWREFVGDTVSPPHAALSLVNSAILMLYVHNREWAFRTELRFGREMLQHAAKGGTFDAEQRAKLMVLVPVICSVSIPRDRFHTKQPDLMELRNAYDPLHQPDAALEDFPSKCISENEGVIRVIVPLGPALRGLVEFSGEA